jgi:F-type H+-transporting ATPase subunit b
MKSALAGLFILAGAVVVHASEAHGGEHHGIPWLMITKQTISFVCVVGILIYFLRKPVVEFFAQRATSFEKLLVLAKKAKEDAEVRKKEISLKLQSLESTANESISKAHQDAEELKQKIKMEAEQAAKSLREEARLAAQHEIERAKQEIRLEALTLAMKQTRESMVTNVAEPDQKRLQNEFVEKI